MLWLWWPCGNIIKILFLYEYLTPSFSLRAKDSKKGSAQAPASQCISIAKRISLNSTTKTRILWSFVKRMQCFAQSFGISLKLQKTFASPSVSKSIIMKIMMSLLKGFFPTRHTLPSVTMATPVRSCLGLRWEPWQRKKRINSLYW